MTDTEDLDTLRGIVSRIAQVRQHLADLEEERDAEVVRAVAQRYQVARTGRATRSRGHLAAVADAAGLSRQRIYTIVQARERAAALARHEKAKHDKS